MKYATKPLEADHNRSAFCCGNKLLDNYIMKQARQDMKRCLSVVFVMTSNNNDVIGYYTLSNDSIEKDVVPAELTKKLPPSYRNLPITLLGRLAVDKKYQGQRIGKKLLIDALRRSSDISQNEIGSFAVVVDPIDEEVIGFYEQYGFIHIPDRRRMFLPMKTVRQLFGFPHLRGKGSFFFPCGICVNSRSR